MKQGRVLLLKHDQAGDALQTLPILRALRRSCPELEITLIASAANFTLFEKEAVRVLCLPKHPREFDDFFKQMAPFDIAINLLTDPFSLSHDTLSLVPARKIVSVELGLPQLDRQIIKTVAFASGQTEKDRLACLIREGLELSHFTFKEESAAPLLEESELEEAKSFFIKLRDKPVLGLFPFSSIQKRCFSKSTLYYLVRMIQLYQKEHQILIFGLPTEIERLGQIRTLPGVWCISPPQFRALTAYLKQVKCVIGVDTGGIHLAQALNKPILCFGRGLDMARWYYPKGPFDQILPRGKVTPLCTLPEILFHTWGFLKTTSVV